MVNIIDNFDHLSKGLIDKALRETDQVAFVVKLLLIDRSYIEKRGKHLVSLFLLNEFLVKQLMLIQEPVWEQL